MKIEERFSYRNAIDALVAKFGWTYKDWMQDWPLEISNEIAIGDCLQEYKLLSNEDQKFILMKAILYALEEFKNDVDKEQYIIQLTEILNVEFDIHKSTVYYWTLYATPEFEEFRITSMMRKIWDNRT